MTSITKINKFRTNTGDQMRVTIPKEIADKFKLKKSQKVLWQTDGRKVTVRFLKE